MAADMASIICDYLHETRQFWLVKKKTQQDIIIFEANI
jgi:hypothetical protein